MISLVKIIGKYPRCCCCCCCHDVLLLLVPNEGGLGHIFLVMLVPFRAVANNRHFS